MKPFCFIYYHLESRWRNSHILVYHGPLLIHLLGVAPSTFTLRCKLNKRKWNSESGQFCWWPVWDGEFTWPEIKGCWWPPTFGDKQVTLNHLGAFFFFSNSVETGFAPNPFWMVFAKHHPCRGWINLYSNMWMYHIVSVFLEVLCNPFSPNSPQAPVHQAPLISSIDFSDGSPNRRAREHIITRLAVDTIYILRYIFNIYGLYTVPYICIIKWLYMPWFEGYARVIWSPPTFLGSRNFDLQNQRGLPLLSGPAPLVKNDGFGDEPPPQFYDTFVATETTDRDRPQQETTPLKEDTL